MFGNGTPAITEWVGRVAWPIEDQVEQDLLLSRLIVEIANDAYLGEELTFLGGTCLHKLHVQRPLRYSEDLDYVRRTGAGSPRSLAATRLGEMLGMEFRTKIGEHPKIYLRPVRVRQRADADQDQINRFERSPAHEPVRLPYAVESMWFAGSADVATFTLAELVATKLRALYQRLKGRDLFDLWLAITELGIDPVEIVDAFAPSGRLHGRARRAESAREAPARRVPQCPRRTLDRVARRL